jgi:hypothetical protein
VENYDEGSIREVSQVALAEAGMGVVAYTQEQPYTAPDGSTAINEGVSANVYRPGLGWDTPTSIETDKAGDSRALSLAMNAAGQTLIAWERGLSGSPASTQVWVAHSTPGQGWSPPQMLSDPVLEARAPSTGMDATGNGLVVWYQPGGVRDEVWWRTYEATTANWGTAAKLAPIREGLGSTPQLSVNPRGDAVVVWGDGNRIVGRYKPQGDTWSRTQRINVGQRGTMSALQVGLADDGQARVSWVFADPRFYPRKARKVRKDIFTARYAPATGWEDPVLINQQTGGNVHEDYHYRLDPYGNATVIWSQDKTLGNPQAHTFINHYAVP